MNQWLSLPPLLPLFLSFPFSTRKGEKKDVFCCSFISFGLLKKSGKEMPGRQVRQYDSGFLVCASTCEHVVKRPHFYLLWWHQVPGQWSQRAWLWLRRPELQLSALCCGASGQNQTARSRSETPAPDADSTEWLQEEDKGLENSSGPFVSVH